MSGLPKRLRQVTAKPSAPAIPSVLELRAANADRVAEEHTVLLGRVRQALAGTNVPEDRHEEIARTVGAVARSWQEVLGTMVETGRLLIRLQRLAGPGGHAALLAAGVVTIEPARASKLRAIASAVDAHLVPAERLPHRLGSAYFLASRPPELVAALDEQGVIRPDVTLPELETAAARITGKPPRREEGRVLAPRDIVRLKRQLAAYEAKIRKLRARLGEHAPRRCHAE